MTISSTSLSLFRRFSRKSKRQVQQPELDDQLQPVELILRPTIIQNEQQQQKGTRKRIAEGGIQSDETPRPSTISTRKVAFEEVSEQQLAAGKGITLLPHDENHLNLKINGFGETLSFPKSFSQHDLEGEIQDAPARYPINPHHLARTTIIQQDMTATPPSKKLVKRPPIDRDHKPTAIDTTRTIRSTGDSRNRTRSEDGMALHEQRDEMAKMSPWRTWGRRSGDKTARSDAPPSAWNGNIVSIEQAPVLPPPPSSFISRRLTKSISFTRSRPDRYLGQERSSVTVEGLPDTVGRQQKQKVYGGQGYELGYILLRPLSPLELPLGGEMLDDPKEVIVSSPDPLSPETPLSTKEGAESEDWHGAGSTDSHATTVYAESRFSMDSNCTPALSMMTASFSPNMGPVRHHSIPPTPHLLTPTATHHIGTQSELLYRKSTSARRPKLQRTLAMSQIHPNGLEDELGERPPSEQEMVELVKLDGKRKNRQSLMQIEDDMAFAKVVTELMQAEKDDQAEVDPEGWTLLQGLGSPSLEMTKHTKTMRAFFLVRELLVGERNYRRHLVKGIEMLMEETIQSSAFDFTYDTNTNGPGKLTKSQKRSSSFMNLPSYAMSKEEKPVFTKSAPGTLKRENRPQSFYVNRSNSELGERRNRTFSDLTVLANASSAAPDRQRICQNLLKHLRELCTTSRRLAYGLEFDPTPNEAAAMFLQHEDELFQVYSDWSAIIGEVVMSGIPTRIPARLAGKNKDPMRQRKRSLKYGTKHMELPSGDLLLADIVIKPTARAGQYTLLFQEILDCLAKSNEDTTLIQQALNSAKKLVAECDRRQDTDMSTIGHHTKL